LNVLNSKVLCIISIWRYLPTTRKLTTKLFAISKLWTEYFIANENWYWNFYLEFKILFWLIDWLIICLFIIKWIVDQHKTMVHINTVEKTKDWRTQNLLKTRVERGFSRKVKQFLFHWWHPSTIHLIIKRQMINQSIVLSVPSIYGFWLQYPFGILQVFSIHCD
jgi:hypothetical protein